MNRPASNPDRATMEAARWLVALEDDPDDADLRSRIDAWRAADPAHDAAWRDTAHVHALMPAAASGEFAARQPGATTARRGGRQGFGQRIAAGVLTAVAAGILLLLAPGLVLRLQSDQVTTTAEVRSIALDDGSLVLLGADSAIALLDRDANRGIRLLKGEAFFQVAPDPERPFKVVARDVEVTVLGTSFNVRLGVEGAEVAVATGVVQVATTVEDRAVSLYLEPGNWARIGATRPVERGALRTDEVAPWRRGQIVARDRPMADVIDELRRYYQGAIVVADDALRGRRVTGVYNLGDPKAALNAIVGAHGGAVRQVSPWLLIAWGS
ncbi:FecR family protein [Reyranella sp.]|uniref:FecR family protein n=1 Tax=Reyranella sp. TaxID=1929291 RepID=UPI003D0CABC8